KVVAGINDLSQSTNAGYNGDAMGDLYEYLLSKLQTSGTNGQFRTPRQIIDMMVEMVKPMPEDVVVDPAAGTAGFLVGVSEYLKRNHKDMFLDQNLREHFNQEMF